MNAAPPARASPLRKTPLRKPLAPTCAPDTLIPGHPLQRTPADEGQDRNPDLLVLEDRPLFASLLLAAFLLADAAAVIALALQGEWAGVGMLGLGIPLLILAAFFFVRRTIVFLDRPGNRVTIRTATLRGQTEDSLPLNA